MEYLFSYGTLQKPEVQMDALRRVLSGEPDVLTGYKKVPIYIDGDEKTAIVPDGETEPIIGTLYEVKPVEFIVLDEFETKAYKRARVILKSGHEAWTYVKND